MTSNKQYLRFLLLPVVLGFALTAFGQEKSDKKEWVFCSDNNYYSGKKGAFRELREVTTASGTVKVDALRNGGISVKGENRSDVLVRACIQSWDDSDAAANIAKNIRIETGSTIRAEGLAEDSKMSVSYEILVPRSSDVYLKAFNGGISVRSVEGDIAFETTNGGVSVQDVSGEVKGRTKNGGVNVVLAGNSWRGSGLDVETTNGGINLEIPDGYAARIETGTVNGGVKNNVSGLSFPENDKYGEIRSKRIAADLNGGGAIIRVVTTNGGVKIGNVSTKVL